MKLDRNVNGNGRGKYALLKLRKLADMADVSDPFQEVPPEIASAIATLEKAGVLDWGVAGTESEFFVIRLKDKYAKAALRGYFNAVESDDAGDMEYAAEIDAMQMRAGPDNPFCKMPD